MQRLYYSAGVGTKFGEVLRGGMFGYGLNDEIIDAYEWLIENYEVDDELFIFGFSRGAYTARSLSGLIAKCGPLTLAHRSRLSSCMTDTAWAASARQSSL